MVTYALGHLRQGEEPVPIKSVSQKVKGSAQFKELFAVVMALDAMQESLNLFSDRLYVVNLLPNLVKACIRLDSNPISPLMIQAQLLLKQRTIFLQHLRSSKSARILL